MTRRIPRWLARAPIPLYRHGLGWAFGPRMVLLEHRGRRTGRPRYVMLEVLDRGPGWLVLVSGYGERSQWLRNVLADPAVRVWTGRVRARPGRARRLPKAQVQRDLTAYRDRHRWGAAMLGRVLNLPELTGTAPMPSDIGRRLPLIRVDYAS